MPLHIDLIERGYFPAEVQPPFQTASYAKHVSAVGAPSLEKLVAKNWWTKKSRHNLARPGGLRRPLSLLNPIGHLVIATSLENAWAGSLDPLLMKATHSASRPIPSSGPRAVAHVGSADIESRRASARSGKSHVLHADIQNFYPSVYTHCIPWALHGKAAAKAGGKATLLGDNLDRAFRGCQDGQTIGIPIGPDASLIIAECLLANVESELSTRVSKLYGYRWIDDFELCFKSVGAAEQCLAILQELLSEFELTLNPRKTYISELPEPQEKKALADLRRWEFSSTPRRQISDLVAYFDHAFIGLALDRGGPLASYAIARLKSLVCTPAGWSLLQDLCLQMITAEPSCARHVIELFAVQASHGHVIDPGRFSEATEAIALKHAPMRHGSEVAWMLWGSIWNKIPLTSAAADAISKMDDNVVALLALQANASGLCTPAFDTSKWAALMETDELRGENWLVAYEASVKGWLPSVGTKDHIASDAFFMSLRAGGVTFFDPTASALPLSALLGIGVGGPSRSIP